MYIKNSQQLIDNVKDNPDIQQKRKDLLSILEAIIESVNPYNAVSKYLKQNPILAENYQNIYLVGFGKASLGMTKAITDSLPIKEGAINTNEHTEETLTNIKITTAGHPLPNQHSINGTEKILDIIKTCNKDDLLIILISGGGSALLCKPRVSLQELQITTDHLLKSGATIQEINTIRKHISTVKGGQLIHNIKCHALCLIISDIVNDPLEFIASGPTSPDTTTYQDACNILNHYNLLEKIPKNVVQTIKRGIEGIIPETPKANNPLFQKIDHHLIANNILACKAAENCAKQLGYQATILTTSLIGESRHIGPQLIEQIKTQQPKHTVFISGGETTVTLTGTGKGGRNQEIALASIPHLSNTPYVFTSFATDGIDGNTQNAGAIVDGATQIRGQHKDLSSQKYLENNDSNTYFKALNDLITTGPTGTNVMDIQLIIT